MKKLDIVLRTHDTSDVHTDRRRYCGLTKFEVIQGCVSSLINAANRITDWEINFTILDDHSSSNMLSELERLFSQSKHFYTILPLQEKGYNYSALKQFETCRDVTADLVYSVEDDYLHCPTALEEMLTDYETFKNKTGKEICMYPFDMPDDYEPPWMQPSFIVHGSKRHWRTGIWTTNTMMCRPHVFQEHWHHFEKLAKEYNPIDCLVHEGNTICDIWKNHALRFSPIPSVALHMQFDTQQDPYINWQNWWDYYTVIQ
jgi:hypothetical protein